MWWWWEDAPEPTMATRSSLLASMVLREIVGGGQWRPSSKGRATRTDIDVECILLVCDGGAGPSHARQAGSGWPSMAASSAWGRVQGAPPPRPRRVVVRHSQQFVTGAAGLGRACSSRRARRIALRAA